MTALIALALIVAGAVLTRSVYRMGLTAGTRLGYAAGARDAYARVHQMLASKTAELDSQETPHA